MSRYKKIIAYIWDIRLDLNCTKCYTLHFRNKIKSKFIKEIDVHHQNHIQYEINLGIFEDRNRGNKTKN